MTANETNAAFPAVDGDTVTRPIDGLNLKALAEAKRLPIEELQAHGCRDMTRDGAPRVQIPYLDESGATLAVRYRLCLHTAPGQPDGRFRWRSGDKAQHLYGIARIEPARSVGWVLVVEGESDSWTGWHYDLPVVGVPGKSCWKSHMAERLEGLEVYVWQEPDAEDFAERIGRDLPNIRVIVAPAGIKDISEAHLAGHDVAALLEGLRQSARPLVDLLEERRHA